MELTPQAIEMLQTADSKALATTGPHGLNVVPVSTIRVVDGNIWLMNYFLGKTLENVLSNSRVSLVGWRGFDGVQVKGTVTYVENGPAFEEARDWVEKNVEDRVVKGLLILTPEAVYDVSP